MRAPGTLLIAPVLIIALGACGTPQASTPASPSAQQPKPTPVSSPTTAPAPRVTVVDAAYVAAELNGVEQGIRLADTPDQEYLSLGRRQQSAYHLLAAPPDWVPSVLSGVSPSVRSAIQAN